MLAAVAVVVAAPELADLVSAVRQHVGRRKGVSRWWLVAAVAVPHLMLVPVAMLLGGAS
jgi:hypothetical protein